MHSFKLMTGVATLAALAGLAQARNIVSNGGFENPEVTASQGWEKYSNGDEMGGWLVGGAGVVLVEGFGSPMASEGDQCVELNFFQGGSVQQELTTAPGQWYHVSFDMAGQLGQGPDLKTLHVYWGDLYMGQFSWSQAGTLGKWQTCGVNVLGTSENTALLIVGEVEVDGGPYIDDVRVEPIPGPGSLAVLAGGGALLGRRRRPI